MNSRLPGLASGDGADEGGHDLGGHVAGGDVEWGQGGGGGGAKASHEAPDANPKSHGQAGHQSRHSTLEGREATASLLGSAPPCGRSLTHTHPDIPTGAG